jgi:hypothetical protein
LRAGRRAAKRKERIMDHGATGLVRAAKRRRAAIAALGAVVCAGLAACATDTPAPAASGSSVAGPETSIGEWKRGGYKPDWSQPDFGGPPPGAH